MTKIKAAFLEGDTKYHISRPGGGPACNADAYFPYSNKTELPRKSVCKNCLRSSMAEYEEIPQHIVEMPDGYRIMKIGEVITKGCMAWEWGGGPWTKFEDLEDSQHQIGTQVRAGLVRICCPVDVQKTPETIDNADSGEPVSDKARIADLEKQVAELNAANDELNEDDARQVQLIGKLEKERDELKRQRAQLIAIDKRVTDYIDDLHMEHEAEVNALKRKLDASSEASTHERTTVSLLTEKLEKAEAARDELLREFKVMRDKFNAASQVIDINMELTAEHGERWKAELLEYRAATKGHTIENITTMMDTMPRPEDLEGYEIEYRYPRIGDSAWLNHELRWTVVEKEKRCDVSAIVRTPIIEYIPTEDICDALCEELGRIPAEFSDTGEYAVDPEERCRGQLVLVVQDPVGFLYISNRGARAWKYCRIERSTIERLLAEK